MVVVSLRFLSSVVSLFCASETLEAVGKNVLEKHPELMALKAIFLPQVRHAMQNATYRYLTTFCLIRFYMTVLLFFPRLLQPHNHVPALN
jgi:hypothetical protein